MKPTETLQTSLFYRDVQEFERVFSEMQDECQKGRSFRIGFTCMKFAMEMIDEISLEKFQGMCQWCDPADRISCAAHAALHGYMDPLGPLLKILSKDEKQLLRPLFSILIDEGKYEVVQMLFDANIHPSPDDFTIWPLLANLDTLELYHRIIEKKSLPNVLNRKYFDVLKSYCHNLICDNFLSDEKKQNVRNFLQEFESHSDL